MNLLNPVSVLAQNDIVLKPKTSSQLFNLTNLTPGSMVSGAITLIMTVVALAFFAMLILGGLKWVVSEGDKNNVEGARNQVTNALIGLAIVFSAWAIMKLIEMVFGISIFGGLTIPSLQP